MSYKEWAEAEKIRLVEADPTKEHLHVVTDDGLDFLAPYVLSDSPSAARGRLSVELKARRDRKAGVPSSAEFDSFMGRLAANLDKEDPDPPDQLLAEALLMNSTYGKFGMGETKAKEDLSFSTLPERLGVALSIGPLVESIMEAWREFHPACRVSWDVLYGEEVELQFWVEGLVRGKVPCFVSNEAGIMWKRYRRVKRRFAEAMAREWRTR